MSMEFGTAAVDTAVMQRSAENLLKTISKYNKIVSDVEKRVVKNNNFWEGVGAEAYRATFGEKVGVVSNEIYEMNKYPTELMRYHKIYKGVISKNANRIDDINSFEMK